MNLRIEGNPMINVLPEDTVTLVTPKHNKPHRAEITSQLMKKGRIKVTFQIVDKGGWIEINDVKMVV